LNRIHEKTQRDIPCGFNRISHLGRAREDAGLTQSALALKANVPRNYISRYEAKEIEPSVGRAIRIAKALNTTVEQLFGDCV